MTSLPKTPYTHRIYMVWANPTYTVKTHINTHAHKHTRTHTHTHTHTRTHTNILLAIVFL